MKTLLKKTLTNFTKITTTFLISTAFLLIFPHLSAQNARNPVQATVKKALQTTIYVKASHSEFTIRLPENVTTGYSWLIKQYNPNFIQVIGKTHQSNSANVMPGAPGVAIFNFKVLPSALNAPQHLKIKLIYARPWQINTGEIRTFDIITGL